MVPANVAHAARKPKVAYSEGKNFAMEVRMSKMKWRGLDVVAGSTAVSIRQILQVRGVRVCGGTSNTAGEGGRGVGVTIFSAKSFTPYIFCFSGLASDFG